MSQKNRENSSCVFDDHEDLGWPLQDGDVRDRLCHGNANKHALRAKLAKRHAAATAPCHCAVASARKIRSVDREMRWRCRLKVLWTAACMLRKRWADRADLKRCCLRSRRRTA